MFEAGRSGERSLSEAGSGGRFCLWAESLWAQRCHRKSAFLKCKEWQLPKRKFVIISLQLMLAPPRSWRPRPLQEEARRGAAAAPPWPPRAPGPVPDVPEAAGGRAGFLPLLPGVLLHQQGELLHKGSPERPGRRRRLKPGPRDTWRLAARLPAPSPHEMGGEGVVAGNPAK